ncbi:MBL fold metallo-hydrolase [Streptomyces sp. NRRL F-5126]|uniref:MBL fold metallo-hydrolase n=1 Tax=Streptomyces sp. NRRL F-5126 TaxID=1463857 RepID=UPI000A99C44A|nr:MBL fold metallo-hydrolase [Streptomyces sp. NRRL F-5126]
MNDIRLRRPSAVRSLSVGELRVSYVPDGAMLLKPDGCLPAAADRIRAVHGAYLNDTRRLVANTGGLLVEHGARALLIDAGYGPHALPEDPDHPYSGAVHGGGLPGSLALVGRSPRTIETVAFTHLHPDHIGWARAEPPLFTRATFVVPKAEWDHRGPGTWPIEAKVRLVLPGEEVFPGVHALALPGHTAGHTGFVIASGPTRLLAFGDALITPLQVSHPDWSPVPDDDPGQSARHRRRLLAELERSGTLGFGIHFADVVFGRVRRTAQGLAWLPV